MSMPFSLRVVGDLILPDPPDREVPGLRMAEVEAAHAGRRSRREALGQADTCPLRVEQREQRPLLRVIGARRVAVGRPDAAEALPDQLRPCEVLVRRVPLVARDLVEPLGKRLGKAIGKSADHDRAVVVQLGCETVCERLAPWIATANAPT